MLQLGSRIHNNFGISNIYIQKYTKYSQFQLQAFESDTLESYIGTFC